MIIQRFSREFYTIATGSKYKPLIEVAKLDSGDWEVCLMSDDDLGRIMVRKEVKSLDRAFAYAETIIRDKLSK